VGKSIELPRVGEFFVASIRTEDGPAPVAVRGGLVHRIPQAASVREMLGEWDRWLARIDGGELEDGVALEQCTLLAPLADPPNVYMAGANYTDHYREMHGLATDEPVPRHPRGPFVFLKPTTSLIGPRDPVVIGVGVERLDWEVELAVVIGRPAHRVSEAAALDHVAAYTIVNDVSARDRFVRSDAEPPFTYDWFEQKGWATSCPLGPWLMPARDCPAPGSLALSLSVNDSVMQDSTTAQMIFSVEELIAYVSNIVPLVSGDVISTGTCGGVGAARGRFLAPGDVMRAEIEGIGVLENPVEAAP
jgi:2-keto-4-pentenoate hydratase/2-oxohepta-3-ene-1,7-dioic acid hydratase in catechol pathway